MSGRFAICLFCDDIRTEVNGKRSLIGCYGSELIVPELPMTLPRLCIVVMATCFFNDPVKTLSISVKYDDFNTAFDMPSEFIENIMRDMKSSFDKERADFEGDEAPKVRLTSQIILSPLQINTEGRLVVHATTEREQVRAGSIRIRLPKPGEEIFP